ncbi:hypothetical protein ACJMK2_034360 [Sinanodonta woodiana]|uniref:Retrovirus-related Pol poly from transposon 412 n=1 Tax=Sinanodonta woodiana TaxID=1069815 RepID=A0ABD3WUQ2_SINWO
MYFVAYCKNVLQIKHDTIQLYLAGVRYHYLCYNHYDPLASQTTLPYVLKGVKKLQSNRPKRRMPITSLVLHKMCNLLKQGYLSPFVDCMLLCAFNLAFFGFLRCGEFTIRDKNTPVVNIVTLSDISLCPLSKYFCLTLKTSKSDPFNKGVEVKVFENCRFNPVQAMISYRGLRVKQGALAQSPLFLESEFDSSPLSRYTFINYLRNVLSHLGYEDSQFSGHSFRIGAATSAAASGVEDHIIKALGRWSSDCYTRYIRLDQKIMELALNDMSEF